MSMEAKITLIESMAFEGTASSGYTVKIDASKEYGGKNAGFRPMGLLLTSLGGCAGASVISILRKKRQDITGFWINLKGERSKNPPMVFTNIEMEYVIKGRNISEKAIRSSIELSKKTCSVMAMLKSTAEITTRYRIINE
ncbi:MAG: OsmC family protein [Nitrospirota bacterium]